MAQIKQKSENYVNFGGINSKTSQYLTGPHEFLDLKNWDFSTPGSLTKRPGTTMYIGQTFAGTKITGVFEFSQLDGSSQLVVGATGGLWTGTSLTSLVAASLGNGGTVAIGASITAGAPSGASVLGTAWHLWNGVASFTGGQVLVGGVTIIAEYGHFGAPTEVALPMNLSSGNLDFAIFANNLFVANGSAFYRYSGSAFTRWGWPRPIGNLSSGLVNLSVGTSQVAIPTGNEWWLGAAYVKSDGTVGPMSVIAKTSTPGYSLSGFSFFAIATPVLTYQSQWDVTGAYYYLAIGGSMTPLPGFNANNVIINDTAPALSTFRFVGTDLSVASSGIGFTGGVFPSGASGPNNYAFFGETYATGGFNQTWGQSLAYVQPNAVVPSFTEIFQNRLFMAGLTGTPSTVWFSELAKPELIDPSFFFEVRTNDGDGIKGLKSYLDRLMIFKERSTHELIGDDPTNFVLRQISDQYGCINNNSAVVYKQQCWFLDIRGICEYNGANVGIISNDKIDPIFQRMNLTAAKAEAFAIHNKSRNEVYFAIPVDGATLNNLIVTHDYVTGAWGTWDGFQPSYMTVARATFMTDRLFFGDYQGRVNHLDSTIFGDNGAGITVLLKTRFLHDPENSVQKQFRRLWVDNTPIGTTAALNVNFYQDYGSSVVASRTMYLNQFQSRIDYGVNARSMSLEMSNNSASYSVKLHGYSIDYRTLRRV